MTERQLRRLWAWAALGAIGAAAASSWWSGRIAIGVLAGGAWNLASLWCLIHLLGAWIGPRASVRRAIGWLLLKFPLLYVLAFGVLNSRTVSLLGFAAGFTVVLVLLVGGYALSLQRLARPTSS